MSELLKAYVMLKSLRDNVPSIFEVGPRWVQDYHSILDKIEKETGQNLTEFRIPLEEKRLPVSRFLFRLEAVLSYFQIQAGESPEKEPIGFKKP
jgi:hypothetical protein